MGELPGHNLKKTLINLINMLEEVKNNISRLRRGMKDI